MGCAQSDPAGVSSPSGGASHGNNSNSHQHGSNGGGGSNKQSGGGSDDSSDQAAARAMQQRRRLSVQMTNASELDPKAIGAHTDEAATGDSSGAATKQFYQTAARSKKGYVPYNSRKQNQVCERCEH
jgi:hypothetical protein